MRAIKVVGLLLITSLFLFVGCKRNPLVKDITKSYVNVLAPANNTTTPNNSITFWWDLLDGADRYEIQIVKPSFSNIQQLMVDTSLTTNKFTYSLNPGTYQWRVRGVNNGGNSYYTVRTLIIDTTSNLAYISVILTFPADSVYSKLFSQSFSWSPVSVATSYLASISGLTSGTSLTTTSFSYTFAAEGTYTWQVRAENSYSISQYSARTIIIDTTRPLAPTLSTPASLGTIHSGDSLKWTRNTGTGKLGAYTDVLYVALSSDSLFNSPIVSQTITGNTAYKVDTLSGIGFVKGSSYFWKLKSLDRATNVSNFSTQRKFKIN